MESKAGSILLLISGILSLVGAVLLLLFGSFIAFFSASTENVTVSAGIILFFAFLFILIIVAGILKLYAAKMMKSPKKTANGGLLGLIVGIVTMDILAIIGGVLGIVDGGK